MIEFIVARDIINRRRRVVRFLEVETRVVIRVELIESIGNKF